MSRRHRPFAVALAALMLLTSVAGVAADDTTTVTVEVRPTSLDGTFEVAFVNAGFSSVETNATQDTTSSGYVQLSVTDRRGTDLPWEVQFSIGDFVGQNTAAVIAASGLSPTSVTIYDYHYNFTNPDDYNPGLQTFDLPTGVWSSTGNQTGGYLAEWYADLTVPAGTAPDYYTSELTLEITSAP